MPTPNAVDDNPSGPSLDTTTQNSTLACPTWVEQLRVNRARFKAQARRRRGFHRMMSGLRCSGEYRLLTLTTSAGAEAAGKHIARSWGALVMRLKRRGLVRDYFKVVEYTRQGRPHYHVILRGSYIAQRVVSKWWAEIHLSPIVDIRRITHGAGLAGYLAKYLGKDRHSRYSTSWWWVWPGWVADWKAHCRRYFARGANLAQVIASWHDVLALRWEALSELGAYPVGVS